MIQVNADGTKAVEIVRDGNHFQCGDWSIEAELDTRKPACLYISNAVNHATFSYGKPSLLIGGKLYKLVHRESSLLFDKIKGEWQVQEMADRKPQLTGSNQ